MSNERHVRARTGLRITVSSTWAIIEALAVGREQRPSTSSSKILVQEGRALEPSDMIDEQIIRRARLARPASKVGRGVVVTWRRRSPHHHPTRHPRAGAFARLELSSRREARVPHALARRGSPGYARARATTLGCEQRQLLSRERTDTRRPSPCARDREAVRALLAGVRSASVWTVSARREPAPWSTSPTTWERQFTETSRVWEV